MIPIALRCRSNAVADLVKRCLAHWRELPESVRVEVLQWLRTALVGCRDPGGMSSLHLNQMLSEHAAIRISHDALRGAMAEAGYQPTNTALECSYYRVRLAS
jgi:hypothetical protein